VDTPPATTRSPHPQPPPTLARDVLDSIEGEGLGSPRDLRRRAFTWWFQPYTEIFLLGRIAEEWRRTRDNRLAVSRGLEGTARIVTAAALLMTVVFAGFVAGGFSPVKQVGFGLALAIVVDATIVRMLLVPAVMSLMGRANWWAPAPLRRLHRRIGLHEAPSAPAERRPAGLAVAQ